MVFDWHQVFDTFRFNFRSFERLSDWYLSPDGVLQSFREVANAKRDGELWSIFSHIQQAQYNRDQLLWAVYINQLPINLIVIMKHRYGIAGKLYAFDALSAFTSNVGLTADCSFF